ncbi:MAG: cytochrome b N-terminal domain-containing protein [Burkholderiales bacterium]|nr:cytochrome b N-terminal domain-containing protein [Burkholderiales bacterium]
MARILFDSRGGARPGIAAPTPPAAAPVASAGAAARAWRAAEHALDRLCGVDDNPLRQLGGLGFYLFWLIAVSGGYLYIFYDTSVAGAHASIEALTHGQWWAGGVMRSLHRYASDAFVVVIVLHLVRELMLGRFRGFRWYSWVSGVPTLWLAVAAGVVGYWMVWDELALFVATATTEWFGALPGFGPALVRNFIGEAAVSDRLFSLVAFLHIGLPLVLLLAMWMHVQRLTRPQTGASRDVALASLAALVVLSLVVPATSGPPADLARVSASLPIDWFYLAPLPAIYTTSPEAVWIASVGVTLLLAVAPWLGGRPRPAPAVVVAQHCNGCRRCFEDCPYAAIAMAPHPSGKGEIAVVDADRCASCGICAGACPSAVPFRSAARLVSGIDLPYFTVDAVRTAIDTALGQPGATGSVLVFACHCGAVPAARPGTIVIGLPCTGMLPPTFVDYGLRAGAAGVVVATCAVGDCEYRFGVRWTLERIAGLRPPRLRRSVDPARLTVVHAGRERGSALDRDIEAFRARLPAGGTNKAAGGPTRRPLGDSTHG